MMKKSFLMIVLVALFLVLFLAACENPTKSDDKLPAPTNVKAKATSSTSIELTWTPVAGAAYYAVYQTTDSTWADYVIIDATHTTTVSSFSGYTANTTYYYKVGAKKTYSNDSVGDLSSAVSVQTPASNTNTSTSTTPPAPRNVSATAHSRIITLQWDAVEKATSYNIYGAFTAGGPYALIGSTSATIFNAASMVQNGSVPFEANTTYYFKVAAPNGDRSVEVSAATGP